VRAQIEKRAEKLLEEKWSYLVQEKQAKALRVKQAAVSGLERRIDMYVNTLRELIEAMGKELEITARLWGKARCALTSLRM